MVATDSTHRRIAAPWRLPLAYLVATLGTVAVFYSRLAMGIPFNDRPLLIMYFIPIVLSAFVGGLWPCLVSTGSAAALTKYFLFPPFFSLHFDREIDLAEWIGLITAGMLASLLSELLHRSRRRAEESQRVQAHVAATVPGVIYAYRRKPDGTNAMPYVSPAVETVIGISARTWQSEASPLFSRIHPDDAAAARAGIAESARTMAPWRATFRIHHPRKGDIWIAGNSIPEREPDGSICWYGFFQDVTEIKRMDERLQQAQKAEALGQLTGGVAHDFNNLLGVVSGNLELLRDAVATRLELHDLADSALTAIDRGAMLTRSLLAFARQQPLSPTAVNVNNLVRDLIPLLQRTLGETIRITFAQAAAAWLCDVDPGQLQNAIINLAVNSRDAMPDGGELTIETANAVLDQNYAAAHAELAPGEYVMLAVSDTGTGMAPEIVARAFEPFFTTKGLAAGSGLGLSMVYGFVKQSRGHVNIYSEPGHGTTVKLYLPRRLGTDDKVRVPDAAAHVPGHEKILVVEDDEAMRRLAGRLLRAMGYAAVEAGTVVEALQVLARDREIALILSDVVLPDGMKGPQLAEQAKSIRPDVKLLYMSGYTDNAIAHHGRLDPGVKLLQKPFRRSELGAAVRAVLDAPQA
jgi:signal transduction histidine kinase/ActR/RegA family two-component response regulator